jgi:hypothetical protein
MLQRQLQKPRRRRGRRRTWEVGSLDLGRRYGLGLRLENAGQREAEAWKQVSAIQFLSGLWMRAWVGELNT